MRRWHSFIEIFQFPLKLLFIAVLLMGIGNLVVNPHMAVFWTVNNKIILMLAEVCKYFGGFLVINFPFFILIRVLCKKYDNSIPVFVGITGFIIFNVVTMFMASSSLPSSAFSAILGISVSAVNLQILSGNAVHYPIQTGFVAVIIVAVATKYAYHRSRTKSPYGFFAFIDKDTWSILSTLIYCALGGLVVALMWPFLIQLINMIFQFIATDITNPMNLFVYGIMDRVLSVFNVNALIRNAFWFGEMGGSWIDSFGVSYLGDVAIWTQQQAIGAITSGVGRLITPYYVLNIFAVPAMLTAFYTLFTDKIEKNRYKLFFLLAIVLSIVTGTLLPLEIFLAISAPLLFVFHVLFSGALFGVFQGLSASLGYTFSGNVLTATPGGLFDLLIVIRNPAMQRTLFIILVVGIISALVYFGVTRYYYKRLAFDLLSTGKVKFVVDQLLEGIGEIENIRMIQSSPTHITIQVFDVSLINFSLIQKIGASKIVETRAGYAIHFGGASTIIKDEINRRSKGLVRISE